MKIIVDKILNKNIYFSTIYGEGKGLWKGVDEPIEKEYFVEFDIDVIFNYNDLIVNKTEEYHIKISDEIVYLTLFLIEYDQSGCATFQLGDSIIEIETNYDARFFALENSYVTVPVEKLNIYDENI